MNPKIPLATVKVMCEAWREMNTIRARDGVPYCHDGRKSDVSQEYWDDILRRLDCAVMNATGQSAWSNPALYAVTEQTMVDLLVSPHIQ